MKILFIIDDINLIKTHKDTSFAFMLEAQKRKYEVYYCQQEHLSFHDNMVFGNIYSIEVFDQKDSFYKILSQNPICPLSDFEVVLMRKDPPIHLNYIYTTYFLDILEKHGVKVINRPKSLRDFNEKFFISQFPQCAPPFIVSSQKSSLKNFISSHSQCVLKPLNAMGGKAIYLTSRSDINLSSVIEILTDNESTPIMAQKFIPEIKQGDKRVLLINGEPIEYGLSRVPQSGDIRGNLAAGGQAIGSPLSEKDYWICEQISSKLKEEGLFFVGIDIIGDYLTEINITSPTCVREIDTIFKINISARFFDFLEKN